MEFTSRVATADDVDELRVVMDASISELQKAFLTDEQIESSRALMGIDNQLIADGTYYVVEREAAIASVGGADAPPCTALTSRRGETPPSRCRSRRRVRTRDVHRPSVRTPRRWVTDSHVVRADGCGRRVQPLGADGHHVPTALVHQVRIRPRGVPRRWSGRRESALSQDGEADRSTLTYCADSSSGLRGRNSGSRSRPRLPSMRVVVASLKPN
jgi:hypothetical protein